LPSQAQERDDTGQVTQISWFRDMGLKSSLKHLQTVLAGGAAGERHSRRLAALIAGQAPD
jgi:hypothetical protein